MLNKQELEHWLEIEYPLTIIRDRYCGIYSDSIFLAFPYSYETLSPDINGDDINCINFWEEYSGIVGKGNSPESALINLRTQIIKYLIYQ